MTDNTSDTADAEIERLRAEAEQLKRLETELEECKASHIAIVNVKWLVEQERDYLRAQLAQARKALETTSDVLRNGDAYGTMIDDTLWVGPGETLLDRVDSVLNAIVATEPKGA